MLQHATITRSLVTVDEAAQRLSISRTGVYRLMDRHELPSVKIGGLRRISVKALDAYIERLEADSETR